MAVYRASEHVVTGFSPNFLMFGREVRAPIDIVLGRSVEEADSWDSANEFVAEVQARYRRAYVIAQEILQVDATPRKDLYDRRVLRRRFQVGTWVWYYYQRRCVGRTPQVVHDLYWAHVGGWDGFRHQCEDPEESAE